MTHNKPGTIRYIFKSTTYQAFPTSLTGGTTDAEKCNELYLSKSVGFTVVGYVKAQTGTGQLYPKVY